jgi:hypothetical protein
MTALVSVACGGPQANVPSNVREEDESAAAHRAEAARHLAVARVDANDTTAAQSGRVDEAADLNIADDMVAQEDEAVEHERDAADLQRVMETDCVNVAVPQRSQCSLGDHRAIAVQDIPNGVTIRFASGGDELQPTLSRIHCSHAYADFAGRRTMPTCVLAIRELTIEGHDDTHAIVVTLTTTRHSALPRLQQRAHALLASQPGVAPPAR